MPHKMNSRSCERINGFHVLLKGYASMAGGLAGDQWNEGDVSCSVVRRVMLPDAFFAIDGLLETYLTVLGQMEVFPGVVNKEVSHYLPFLLTTTVLMEAVKAGAGREEAHEAIKEHAVATIRDLRGDVISENDLAQRLAGDSRIGLSEEELAAIMDRGRGQIGAAGAQVDNFCKVASDTGAAVEGASDYKPGSIL